MLMNPTMDTQLDLRDAFLGFFKNDHHTVMKSSPLVTAGDPTLMFVNAGMVPFKEIFTGQRHSDTRRAATCQKCMRVSGKHNDLEEVGKTPRHHTLFEMLGNFSFGDYFKEHAIECAWTFMTRELALPKDKLWVTVFEGDASAPADDEAAALWRKISGLPEDRILRCPASENFWAMGDTGPCGPCTEIHVDMGDKHAPAVTRTDFETGRILEIWNLVFMQFNRTADGVYHPLPAPCVDTGMGLERVTAVYSGEKSNYHTPLFLPLLAHIAEEAKKTYTRSASDDDMSMRVIADHARATAFLMADGVRPSNEGRGYVLRRIMRRAIRHADKLGIKDLFFHRICMAVGDVMGGVYPELHEARAFIEKMTMLEEETFRRTLKNGLQLLGHEIESIRHAGGEMLSGDTAFKLYDTYGFPKDLTEVITREHGIKIDETAFSVAMDAQRERSRGGVVGDAAVDDIYTKIREQHGPVTFVGYPHEGEERDGAWRTIEHQGSTFIQTQAQVVAIIADDVSCETLDEGVGYVVLNPTPMYGESGGQVGDVGLISSDHATLEILDTQRPIDDLTVCKVRVLQGALHVKDAVWVGYDCDLRAETRIHHSATHLLHASLRKILGDHVAQAGSFVDHEKLRFDFSHTEAISASQRAAIEADVNASISASYSVQTDVLPFQDAKQKGALALFGEKYGDTVRVISMGGSVEFCGGTHVHNTSDVGMLLITQEGSLSTGVRRMEAMAGLSLQKHLLHLGGRIAYANKMIAEDIFSSAGDDATLVLLARVCEAWKHTEQAVHALGLKAEDPDFIMPRSMVWHSRSRDLAAAQQLRDLCDGLTQILNSKPTEAAEIADRYKHVDCGLLANIAAIQRARRGNERLLEVAKQQHASSHVDSLAGQRREIAGISVLAAHLIDLDAKDLRALSDELRNQLGSGVYCLAAAQTDKVSLLVAVTPDLAGILPASKLIASMAPYIGGRGGGKPDLAQAGGTDAHGIPGAFAKLEELIANR